MVRPSGARSIALTLFDHHVHSDRSDGSVSLTERGRSAEHRPHGISDHYPWGSALRDDAGVLRYIDDATRAGLRVGLEFDLGVADPLRPSTRDALHYLIGSIHQIEIDGAWISYDAAGAFVKDGSRGAYAERERFADPALQRRILERTLAILRQGISEVGVDIVGHPTFSPLAALGDPEGTFPVDWQERFIALCVDSDVAIEVNETYGLPHREFLRRAARAGARFSVGSDAHGALRSLERSAEMITQADLPLDRFLSGQRVRTDLPR